MSIDEYYDLKPGDIVQVNGIGENVGIICEVVRKFRSVVEVDCLTRPAKFNGKYVDNMARTHRIFNILRKGELN